MIREKPCCKRPENVLILSFKKHNKRKRLFPLFLLQIIAKIFIEIVEFPQKRNDLDLAVGELHYLFN